MKKTNKHVVKPSSNSVTAPVAEGKYKKWAAHANLNIEYQKYFFNLINKIENNKIFTFLRICDGDYHNIFLKKSCDNLVDQGTILKVSEALGSILATKTIDLENSIDSNLIIALQFGTQYDRDFDPYINQFNLIKDEGYSSALFSWAYATDNMLHLFYALQKVNHPIIIIGPEYLSKLSDKFKISSHIKTPIQKTWLYQNEIEKELEDKIVYYLNIGKSPILLYACSVSAKLAISKYYYKFGKNITQIDIGSNFDPYANKINRGWHQSEENLVKIDLFKHYNMNKNLGTKVKYRDFSISTWPSDIPDKAKDYIKANIKENSKLLEIGVHGGFTLLKIFDLVNGIDCKIYGIDCWEDIDKIGINGIPNSFWTKESLDDFLYLHKQNRLNLENILSKYDTEHKCQLIKGFSQDAEILSLFSENSIDYLYIDGDHSYIGCYNDLTLWYPKVKIGGFIIGDDAGLFGVKKAYASFCKLLSIEYLVEGNKFFIIKK